MKCPLLTMAEITFSFKGEGKATDCLKEECAWWDEEKVCCLLRTLTKQVTRLAENGGKLK